MRPDSPSGVVRALAGVAALAFVPSVLACQSPRPNWFQPQDQVYLQFYENVAGTLLEGYRIPETRDFESYWRMVGAFPYQTTDNEGETKAPFWTKGLFNADDVVDWAFLLVDEEKETFSLLAVLSSSSGYEAVLLAADIREEMGLATVLPTSILAQPDGSSEWIQVEVIRAGIAFMRFESSSSVFIWDEDEVRIRRYWIS